MIGTRLGPYEITAKLGEGGMGEVWRATDTRLGREVAVKLLPEGFSTDPEHRARFEREAKLLASLNHPYIATLYGLEQLDGQHALVMELVEGESLDARIARGAVPLDEAVPIARQIAEALETAHEHGIIHRDLKPANVKVRADGTVKVLDFGLAKAWESEFLESDPSLSPTLTAPQTRAGLILGTAAYMAPEQARGKPVDRRADIWAFGVVLFEMLVGRRLFTGESVSDTLAAVLSQDIDQGWLPSATPAELRALLSRCLERDSRRRLRDIGEARIVLETPFAPRTVPVARQRGVWPWLAGLAAVATLALSVGFLAGRRAAVEPAQGIRMVPLTFRRGSVWAARFAADGRTVVYCAAWEGAATDLYSVRLDTRESGSLGLKGAALLSVSSRGELTVALGWRNIVGYEITGTLARVPMGGGAPRELLEDVEGADWSPDGTKLAVVRDVGSERRLEYPIGRVLYETGGWISNPRVSRDGTLVAFLDHPNRGDNVGSVKVVDAKGTARQVAARAWSGLAWSADGEELLYPVGTTLWATTLSGRARVLFRTLGSFYLADVSPQGDVLLGRVTAQREMVGAAPRATREHNLSWLDWSFPTALSDDGRQVLFEEETVNGLGGSVYALFLRPTDGAPAIRLGDGHALAISADGKRVLATTSGGEPGELMLIQTGPGETRRLGGPAMALTAAAFLPDGRRAVLAGHMKGEPARLFVLDLASGAPRSISPEGTSDYYCDMVSPDGRTAFAVAPDGAVTLYPVDGGTPRPVPGTSHDDVPLRWGADGRHIFVHHGPALPARVELVDVATGARTPWKELTPPDPAGVSAISPIQVSADGRAYVYSYRRYLGQLFVVEGLR
jgi:hypothetical protein